MSLMLHSYSWPDVSIAESRMKCREMLSDIIGKIQNKNFYQLGWELSKLAVSVSISTGHGVGIPHQSPTGKITKNKNDTWNPRTISHPTF